LTRNSPSLAGASGANILTSNGNFAFTNFVPASSLGLSNTDNIDGLDILTTDDPDATIMDYSIQRHLPGDHDSNGIYDQSDCDAFLACFHGVGVSYDTDGTTTYDVSIGPSHYSPPVVTIEPGDTVRWTWAGGTHNVTSGSAGIFDGMFRSGSPTSVVGTVYQVPFTYSLLDLYPTGDWVYPYFCQTHVTGTGSVHVVADPCAGSDLDFDGDVDCADWRKFRTLFSQYNPAGMCNPLTIPEFVAALLGTPFQPVHLCMADMNLDGFADGRDVMPYVDAIIP
jgi:plastocyanin